MKRFLIKLNKQGKLKLIEPSENISQSYLKKSFSNFDSSKILLQNNKLEEPVSLAYYSMYNLVLSLLFKIGIKSENHNASIFLLKEIFNIDNFKLIEAKKERIDKQYYVDSEISKKEVELIIKTAEEFNRNLKGFISGVNNENTQNYREKFKGLLNP